VGSLYAYQIEDTKIDETVYHESMFTLCHVLFQMKRRPVGVLAFIGYLE
jgi:hypothetical protein